MAGKRKVVVERNPNFGKQRNYGLDTGWFSYGDQRDDEYNNAMSTLPEVPEWMANAELEKGEVVVGSDQQGQPMQYKVGGDRHHSGGTPTVLAPGDFVFSDTRKMKLKDEEILKHFGKSKPSTPAQIAKGYNIKPYQNTLQNPDADPIAKKTAQMMVGNYMDKLNDLAMVQESQKGFPNGIPTLSDNVAVGKMGGKYKCQYGGQPVYMPPNQQVFTPTDSIRNQPFVPNSDNLMELYNKSRSGNLMSIQEQSKISQQQMLRQLANDNANNYYNQQTKRATDSTLMSPSYMQYQQGGYAGIGPLQMGRQPLNVSPQYYPWNMQPIGLDGNVGPAYNLDGTPGPGYQRPWQEGDPVSITPYDYGDSADNVMPESKTAKLITPTPQITQTPQQTTQVIPGGKTPLGQPRPGEYNPQSGKKPPFQYTGADAMALGNAFSQLGVKKYLPWEAAPELQAPQYSQFDPSREIAASQEGVNSAMQAAMYSGNPQLNRALLSQLSGQSAGNIANIMARYNGMNIDQSNRQADVNTSTRNQNAMMRGDRATRLYDKSTIANQQYDNALRDVKNNYTGASINAWNNRMNLYNMNVENPQYYIDPGSGKVVFKGNPSAFSGAANAEPSSEQMASLFESYKQKYPTASDSFIEKLVMKDMQQGQISTSSRNTRTRGMGNLGNQALYAGVNPYQ